MRARLLVVAITGFFAATCAYTDTIQPVPDRGQSTETITHGREVDITKHLALGNVTIVDYYADWCGPCKLITPTIQQLSADPEVAVRKIDIVNWGSDVAKQYRVASIPRVEVYGRDGKLVGRVNGVDPAQIRRYVAQAKSGAH